MVLYSKLINIFLSCKFKFLADDTALGEEDASAVSHKHVRVNDNDDRGLYGDASVDDNDVRGLYGDVDGEDYVNEEEEEEEEEEEVWVRKTFMIGLQVYLFCELFLNKIVKYKIVYVIAILYLARKVLVGRRSRCPGHENRRSIR